MNEVISVKVIRNKQTSQSEGYGFIEFTSRAAAERILQSFNGALMPNGEQDFRLNWATFSAGARGVMMTVHITLYLLEIWLQMLRTTTFRRHLGVDIPRLRGLKERQFTRKEMVEVLVQLRKDNTEEIEGSC
ncbi:Polyadenylate-binding proteinA [Arachis hypogaea]|nr:Polyadenylate-binding proteinA [Arachis hypogaea]